MILRINKGELKLGAIDVPLEILVKTLLESHLFEYTEVAMQNYLLRRYLLTDYYLSALAGCYRKCKRNMTIPALWGLWSSRGDNTGASKNLETK